MKELVGIDKKGEQALKVLREKEQLSEKQQQQFEKYLLLLLEWNEKFNITAITSHKKIVIDHFRDSLQIDRFVDFGKIKSLCDIGSGGGFPGIPLKIKYPSLPVVLIEVNRKKINFLRHCITELGLEGIEVYDLDWRTFLRTTEYEIDLFCVRASLPTDELIRMLKPGCRYKNAQLVYWASKNWEPGKKELPFVKKEETYHLNNKERRLIFLGLK